MQLMQSSSTLPAPILCYTWWRHQMETFSALLALCAGNSPVSGEFPAQRPVTRSFDVSLICIWINGCENSREAGDLRSCHTHYEVIVMITWIVIIITWPNFSVLTHWGRDKMAAIFQTTFSNAFSWMKMYKFRVRFHWNLFPRVQLTISQHWFR